MKIKRSSLVQLALILYVLNVLLKYFLPSSMTKILPILACFIAILACGVSQIQLLNTDKLMLVFLVFWMFGCFYSDSMMKGFGYVFSFALAYVFVLIMKKQKVSFEFTLKILMAFCTFYTIILIIQSVNADAVASITKMFSYTSQEYSDMASWAKNGWYSGLFNDRAPAAFYSGILVGGGLVYLFKNRESAKWFTKLFGIIFVALGGYGLILTAKRGPFIAVIFAAFICYFVDRKARGMKIYKIVTLVVVIAIVLWVIVTNLEAASIILDRFFDNDDVTTGRLTIYANLFAAFWTHPIFGNGTASANSILGVGGHNIYFTVLLENGIIGFILFVGAWVAELISMFKMALSLQKRGYERYSPMVAFALFLEIFFVIYGMSGNPLYDNYILYMFIFAMLIRRNVQYQIDCEEMETGSIAYKATGATMEN